MQGRGCRLLGFLGEAELEFFELFLHRGQGWHTQGDETAGPADREIADAIQRQDSKWLTTLPGVERRPRKESWRRCGVTVQRRRPRRRRRRCHPNGHGGRGWAA
jgi:hypothetical protein